VYAFDVGTGQMDWKLRNDPRVVLREALMLETCNQAMWPNGRGWASAT